MKKIEIKDLQKKYIDHLLKHRLWYLFSLLALSLFFLISIFGFKIGGHQISAGLKVKNTMDVWYDADDPIWLAYQRFQEQFVTDEFIILAFQADDIFQPVILKKIADLTEKLTALPHVIDVTSLTNIDYFHGKDGAVIVTEFIPEIPYDRESLDRLKKLALQNPLYLGNIISADGRTTAILVQVKQAGERLNYQRDLTDIIYDFVERENEDGKYDIHVAGATPMIGLQDKASSDDALLEGSLSIILLSGVLFFMHRRFILVFMSIVMVVLINIWIHGLMALWGSNFNMLSSMMVSLVLVIAIAESIHFISEYRIQSRLNKGPKESARQAFLLISMPCLFTCLTTASGFLSMTISHMKAMQVFSIYAAIAMLITFLISIVLLPIWLSYIDTKPNPPGRLKKHGWTLHGFLKRVSDINRKHVKINIAIALLVFLVSFTGLVKIEINSHAIEYFRDGYPIRKATKFIEKNLAGTIPLEIMLEGEDNTFIRPEVLKRVEELQLYIATAPNVSMTFSLVDFIKEMNRAFSDGDPASYKIPDTMAQVAQLLILTEGDSDIESYMSQNYETIRVHARVNNIEHNAFRLLNSSIDHKAKMLFGPLGIKSEVVGLVPLGVNLGDYVVDTQIRGFGLALVSIFFMLSLLVRSFRLGLLAMVPNVIPIFLTFGIMGWMHIYLDTGTVLIASIAIGLAVDDTIHFISRFRILFDQCRNYETALEETLLSIGRPITITSIVLFFGFGVLIISSFKPMGYFGILAAITMISALIADFFVLPALIKVVKPFGPEEVVLGSDLDRAGVRS